MTRNEFELLYAIYKEGLKSQRELAKLAGVSLGYVNETLKRFFDEELVIKDGITNRGREMLEPYKVKNAVIMAAGMSTRFVPLSLEKPKGLLRVKDEILIERQIEQLKEAGIDDIILVLGYKKESFFYLADKYGARIIINPEYNTKNNIETLYLAREHIGNTYICSSDDYFARNVFEPYVYQSYYAAVHVHEKTNEWYMIPDHRFNVSKVEKSGEDGYIMLGHVYFDEQFGKEFVRLIEKHHEIGDYDQNLWEDLFADNIKKLPPMEIRVYDDDVIFEFDSLEDLRSFDERYVKDTSSAIMKNICKVLECREEEINDLKMIKKGLSNTSFSFAVRGKRYVYRHPDEGSRELIDRRHEKKALELAKSAGIDPTFIRMDEEEGYKISEYVDDARTADYDDPEDMKRIAYALRDLHDSGLSAGWTFRPWEEACRLEDTVRKKNGIGDQGFQELKDEVRRCYEATVGDGVKECFCHCDTYAGNWLLTDGRMILIDWEYAADADPGCDTGSFIMDSDWNVDKAKGFIREYLQDGYDEKLLFHHLAYTALLSYYWYVWALYQESCGAVMGDSLYRWRVMARRYSRYLIEHYEI